MTKFKVVKPYKDINEWEIHERHMFFFWRFEGTVLSNRLHAFLLCNDLNGVNYD